MQTKTQSFIESLTNILIGYTISVLANLFVLPLFGYEVSISKSAGIGLVFTAISLIRSYIIRRWFNKRG